AKQAQLDAPGMIPECQGGWFASVGGTLSEKQDGVTAAQINGISLMALSHGVTILNYYMLFGGTNVGDWGARTQTTTYDYASPIRESGGVGDKYLAVKAIGGMLKQIGPTLARAQSVSCRPEGIDANVMVSARRAADGQTFIFCWNRSRERATEVKGTAVIANESPIELSCKLDPFGFKVLWLHQGQSKWLPEPAPAIERPSVPQPIQITQAQRAVGEAPDAWTDQSPGATLAASGVWDSRYVMYRTKFSLTPEQVEQFKTLQIKQPGSDPLLASVNAKLVAPSRYLTRESRIALGDNLHSGDNEITILYENQGYPNFGPAIEQPAGLTGGSLVYSKTPDVMLTQWKVHLLEGPPQQRSTPSTQPDFDDASWPGCTLDAQGLADLEHPIQPGAEVKNAAARTLFGRNNARAVFRTTLDVTDEMIKGGQTQLVFERLDDQGTVYVNGEEAGRVRSFTESLTIDGAKFLKPGKNVIVAVVTNREGDGGITKPVSLVGTQVERLELNWQLAKDLSQPKTWQPVTLGTDSSAADGQLMTWYQVEFELPEASKDVWIPWLAHIQASGNGMIWLNGQHLGRYWQVGPQTEFFLPECWLNFGSGKKNVLTMCLRPIDRPASLNAIEIAPYPNAAERR
ncbi:MAG TPA: beta-galactosidase, partial [Tepidisphaeraceae bacterium]